MKLPVVLGVLIGILTLACSTAPPAPAEPTPSTGASAAKSQPTAASQPTTAPTAQPTTAPNPVDPPIAAFLPTNTAPDKLKPNTPSPIATPLAPALPQATLPDVSKPDTPSPDDVTVTERVDTIPNFNISILPPNWQFLSHVYTKYVTVFGVHLFATEETSDSKIAHASNVLAQYLDNDENGMPDNPAVVKVLADSNASIVMFATEQDGEVVDESLPEKYHNMLDSGELRTQDLNGEETNTPNSGSEFDASLEEILHLITSVGYSQMYPKVFGENTTSEISSHMDVARGGHFEETSSEDCEDDEPNENWRSGQCAVPPGGQYPEDAWYSYQDTTCDYACMITEYFYWSLTSFLGGQSEEQRCNEIKKEWALCTDTEVKLKDPDMYNLLTDPQFALPKMLPDGRYNPTQK